MVQTVKNQNVFKVLDTTGAKALRSAEIGEGLSVAQWFNECGEAEYDQPGHHTFSVYLRDGEAVERIDERGAWSGGAPGKICLLPEDHRSRWNIPQQLEMFHLYFTGEKLKSLALKVFDRAPQQVDLQDLTFEADDYAGSLLQHVVLPLDWKEKTNKLALSSAADLFLLHILKNYSALPADLPAVKGGLPPYLCKLLEDYLNTHFADPICLDDLADLTGYSSYHFARMFKESFALPPHRYLNALRIEKAKSYLSERTLPLSEVALACGFSSQAHFSANFKKATGVTPLQFRKL
ncbi:MAG: AraC family transcriptional regulator [Sneathiellales bacterium]|nr:AraC family transcriptional regulator [Sneathiellales bacterium]